MTANGYTLHNGDLSYGAASQSPPQAQSQQPQPNNLNSNPAAHTRTYQACIPCRQRKVRCDLGSVDNPNDPPCTRCRREAKECYFSATRRKKKNATGDGNGSEAGDDSIYEVRTNRKRLRTSAPPDPVDDNEEYEEPPRTPGGSVGRTQPLRRPTGKQVQYGEEEEKKSEAMAAFFQRSEVHGGHDALNVLYHAAVHGRSDSTTSSSARPTMNGFTSGSLPDATSPVIEKVGNVSYTNGPMAMFQNDDLWKTRPDKNSSAGANTDSVPTDLASYTTAMKAWSRFKFVRSGWFTAREGIEYILYFYKHLSPLTPVAFPDFRQPATHQKLLEDEPMLAITILLIASRHMKLNGPGSQSRPYAIHQALWSHLSGMIDRLVWGQEQFGGGFCGAGGQPGCDVNPLTRKGLRTLGSVESLVLLTEWHPRAMHFPPNEDDDDLMIPDKPADAPDLFGADNIPKGIGGHRMDAWLEPCWRSDRMCWMLLGMAMSLAMEIGVFDSSEWQRHARSADGSPLSAEDITAYDKRRGSVRDLLLVYVTQTSGRLGLTSMLPSYYSKPEDSDLFKKQVGQQDSVQEITFHFWLRIAALLREGNNKIFANKSYTRDLIRNGDYKAVLAQLQEPLRQWRQDFDDCKVIPKHMRSILEIEFEYCRVYMNALSLQAMAERCANDHPSPIDPPLEMARSAIANGVHTEAAIPPATLSKWLGGDRHYIQTVGDSARNLLKVVVEGLYPDGFLRHAPVRTYFRIISVAIMLLKSFALGATEGDVNDSLSLLDRTVEALRSCIVDDVHVASRFADLLDTATQNLKPLLVRMRSDGRGGRGRHVGRQESSHANPAVAASIPQAFQGQGQAQATAGAAQQPQPQQQWHYNNSMMADGQMAGANPMYGISNDTYDLMATDNGFSVMPPPGFSISSPSAGNVGNMANGSANGTYDSYANNFGEQQDWLAIPLDPIIHMPGADVNQTQYGTEVNGHDMLELLLNQVSHHTNHF
ncbi:Transcriptional activator ARO80 [Lecanosticta acicola]|uniref:Transcriptional activator ARO80 n=1 Tax=Lecanosticta acicola TaxID=111012 RepID=A0AAI8YS51_9PEZI|nr:Transcriptional activator ARO80 [Lecanosticta acicola]